MNKIYETNILFKLLKHRNKEEQRDILAIVKNILKNDNKNFLQYLLSLTSLKKYEITQLLEQKEDLKNHYESILLDDISIEGEKYLNFLLEYLKQTTLNKNNKENIDKIFAKLIYDKDIKENISKYIKDMINEKDSDKERKKIEKELLSKELNPYKNNFIQNKINEIFAFSSSDGEYGVKYLSGKNDEIIHIFVNGFTNDTEKDNYIDWKREAKNILDEQDFFYGYDWASGKELSKMLPKLGGILFAGKGNVYYTLRKVAYSFYRIRAEWKQARDNSEKYSEKLAFFIEKQLEENPNRIINLYGHSLGANLLHYTLKHLYRKELKVNDVYLFGGASEINKEAWTEVLCSANNIYNYYSKKDQVLTSLFQSMEWCSPIGLNPITYNQKNKLAFAKLYNYDVSNHVNGHTEYIPNFNFLYRWKYR